MNAQGVGRPHVGLQLRREWQFEADAVWGRGVIDEKKVRWKGQEAVPLRREGIACRIGRRRVGPGVGGAGVGGTGIRTAVVPAACGQQERDADGNSRAAHVDASKAYNNQMHVPAAIALALIAVGCAAGGVSSDAASDSALPDTAPPSPDSTIIDPPDTAPADTAPADTGPADTGTPDAPPTDTGPADTGPADTGPADTGPMDTGPVDTGAPCPCASCAGRGIVFVTSSTYTGSLGGLGGADGICNTRATAAGLAGTYTAWLSDHAVSARDRVSGGPWFDTTDALVACDLADLLDGPAKTVNVTELGTTTAEILVWTGTRTDGAVDAFADHDLCSEWTASPVSPEALMGRSDRADTGWTTWQTGFCSNRHPIYCFQTGP